MVKLHEMVRVLRSKNAGPFQLTYDLIFDGIESYERAVRSGIFNARDMAARLKRSETEVTVDLYPVGNAIKITVPRIHSSGSVGDTDVFGCQQHAPLMEIEVP